MKNIIVAPFGPHTDSLYIGIRELPTERIFLITPKDKVNAAEQVKSDLGKFKIPIDIMQIEGNLWDETFRAISEIKNGFERKDKSKNKSIIVNIGMADRNMMCAATSAADGLRDIGISITIDPKSQTMQYENDGKVIGGYSTIWGIQKSQVHGLITISPYDAEKIKRRVFLKTWKIKGEFYSEYDALKIMPTVSSILNGGKKFRNEVYTEELKKKVAEVITKKLTEDGSFKNENIFDKVVNESIELAREKHSQDEWVYRHLPTFKRNEVEKIPGSELDGPLEKERGYCLWLFVKPENFREMSIPRDETNELK